MHLRNNKTVKRFGEDEEPDPKDKIYAEEIAKDNWRFEIVLVSVLVGVGLLYLRTSFHSEEILFNKVLTLKDKFRQQEDALWHKISGALDQMTNPESSCPRVLLFLVEKGPVNETTSCLISKVANDAAPLLPFEEKVPLIVEVEDLNHNDDMSKIRMKVEKHGIVIMNHIEKISYDSANPLHYLCDEYHDLVKSLFFLTLTVPNVEGHAATIASTALTNLWQKMQEGGLDALVTRLTAGGVIVVKPEDPSPCS